MDSTTKTQVDKIIEQGWFRKSQTLGEGGWAKIYASGIDWKTYVLYGENEIDEENDGSFNEIETIMADDDATAMKAFSSLYYLDMFVFWEVQERITEFRLVSMKVEE